MPPLASALATLLRCGLRILEGEVADSAIYLEKRDFKIAYEV